MSKTFILISFLYVALSLWMQTSFAAFTITWKKYPPKCYSVVAYRRTAARTVSDCQRACEKDRKCVQAQFLMPICSLMSLKSYRIIGCRRKSILLEKVRTKVASPTTKPTTMATTMATTTPTTMETTTPTTMAITTIATTLSTLPVITGPTPKWKKYKEDENCFELESSYSDFKVENRTECKLKCYLNENCLVLEFRPDHSVCKLSNKWRFNEDKFCRHWSEIFMKDLKKCPLQGEICPENAVCVNIPNTYQCRCIPGHHKELDGKCVKDVNECLESKDACDKNTVCIDTPSSYECHCRAGYRTGTDGKKCIRGSRQPSDEHMKEVLDKVDDGCVKNNRLCSKNSVCVGKSGSMKFKCECIKGYKRKKHTKTCEDIDECTTFTKSELGCDSILKCFNTIGSYYCACSLGYKNVDGKCKDVDECAQRLCGANMDCQNYPGSYSCSCRKGYREEMHWCNDVDECRDKNGRNLCRENQTCMNAPGSYKCSSCGTSGYNKPGNCKEPAEESNVGKPGEGRLKNHAVVSFSGKSYMRFETPAILKSNASVSIWLTIRPNTNKANGIIIYAEKVGHKKFFGLALKDGVFELSFNTGSGPEKLQSASPLNSDTWHGIEVIFRMDKIGFIKNEKQPLFKRSKYKRPLDVDDIFYIGGIDSASDATPNVMKNLHIDSGLEGCIGLLRIGDVDYDLSYPGHHIKKQENISPCEDVTDIDDCPIVTCGQNSVCTNTIGKYRCSCKEGYAFADDMIRICDDIDECTSENIECGKNAKCKNTDGGYHCECLSGFYNYTTKSCQDSKFFPMKDGWFINLDSCESATCKNRIMMKTTVEDCKERCMMDHTCAMIKFKSSRTKCSLCQSTEFRIAHKGGRCTPGNSYDFYMKATKNFKPIKKQPVKATEPPTPAPSDSNRNWIALRRLCVHTDSYSPRHIVTAPECTRLCEIEPGCVMAKYSSAASLCWLSKSRKMATLGSGCDGKFRNIYDYFVKPLDECNGKTQCPDHSECLFEKGHRYCKCRDGFEQHGKKCKDIDECALYKDLCGEHAKCVNTLGSYKCSCDRHYIGDGFVCLHKNERHAISFGAGLASSN